jgi:hypothetical protein
MLFFYQRSLALSKLLVSSSYLVLITGENSLCDLATVHLESRVAVYLAHHKIPA